MRNRTHTARFGKGAAVGAIGGLVAAWTMSLSAVTWNRMAPRRESSSAELARMEAGRFVSGSSQELDSIGAAADWIDRLTGHRLSPRQKGFVAAAVHYGMGAGLGAAYGAIAERVPAVTVGLGSVFGVGESLTIESVGMSMLTGRQPLREYSMGEHLRSAVDHAVYGFTLELTRRNLRKVV